MAEVEQAQVRAIEKIVEDKMEKLLDKAVTKLQEHQTLQMNNLETRLQASLNLVLERRFQEQQTAHETAMAKMRAELDELRRQKNSTASSWADETSLEDVSMQDAQPAPKWPRTARAKSVTFAPPARPTPATTPTRATSADHSRARALTPNEGPTVVFLGLDELMDNSERWSIATDILNSHYENSIPPDVRPVIRGTMSKVFHVGFPSEEAAQAFINDMDGHPALHIDGASSPLRLRINRPPRNPELARATNRVVAILHQYQLDDKLDFNLKVRSDQGNGALYVGRQHIGNVMVTSMDRIIFVPNAIGIRSVNLNLDGFRTSIRELFHE